ncbi:MAG: isochorismatase family protein [Pseudomonadota bacterium]
MILNCGRLLGYARRLEVPGTVSEHYPSGLGSTVAPLREIADTVMPQLEKITFSAWAAAAIRDRLSTLREDGRDQVVVAGMEAHVCVCQTALDLIAQDFNVYVVADAVGSRASATCDHAVARMRDAGAAIVSQEMVAFEWLERGDTPEFKDLLGLIK